MVLAQSKCGCDDVKLFGTVRLVKRDAQRPQPTSTAEEVGLRARRPVSKGLPGYGRRLSLPQAQDLRARRLLRTALLVRVGALRRPVRTKPLASDVGDLVWDLKISGTSSMLVNSDEVTK